MIADIRAAVCAALLILAGLLLIGYGFAHTSSRSSHAVETSR